MIWHKVQGAGGTGGAAISFNYNGYNEVNSPDTTSYTFPSVNFDQSGTKIVVAVIMGSSASLPSVSSVTIAGVSATLVTSQSGFRWGAVYYAVVSASSGDLVINFTDTPNYIYASTTSIYGYASDTPAQALENYSNAETNGVSPTLSDVNNVSGNSLVIAAYHAGSVASSTSDTWTGVSEVSSFYFSARTAQYTEAVSIEASGTITATLSDGSVNRPILLGVVWK